MNDAPAAPKKPKLKPANENPWYCLMTLHGEQQAGTGQRCFDNELHARNRLDWNKWASRGLSIEQRSFLLWAKDNKGNPRFSNEELTPHTDAEFADLVATFRKRGKAGGVWKLPKPDEEIKLARTMIALPIYLAGYLIPARIRLSGANFSDRTDFSDATFSGDAYLRGATFAHNADLRGVTFSGNAYLSGATFSRNADLSNTVFAHRADLTGATFSRNADLSGATFSRTADLSCTVCARHANLSGATFRGRADLSGATFSRSVDLSGTKFSRNHAIKFDEATFSGKTSFLNAEMEGDTSFARAQFKTRPPSFHGAKLNEGTSFDGVEWPNAPVLSPKPATTGDTEKDKKADGEWKRARDNLEEDIKSWQRLKQMMETLKKHEDELDFFAKEMECKQALHRANGETGKARLLWLYEGLSDYGRSVARPAIGLAITLGVSAFIIAVILSWGLPNSHEIPKFPKALNLTYANLLSPLNIRKDFFDANELKALPASVQIISGFQTVAGVFFTFLIGLALRNRFRMK